MKTVILLSVACLIFVVAMFLLITGFSAFSRLQRKETTMPSRRSRGLAWRRLNGALERMLRRMRDIVSRFGHASQHEDFERTIPQMIDVLVLGLQAGLSFDQAFMLYAERFESNLSRKCQQCSAAWQSGLSSRTDALHDLAIEVDVDVLYRMVDLVTLALQFGVALTPLLALLADDARKSYRARTEENVLKAGTKMLIPTGLLILPALLMLVMGPAILQIAEEFF